jgi:hypothetical protein
MMMMMTTTKIYDDQDMRTFRDRIILWTQANRSIYSIKGVFVTVMLSFFLKTIFFYFKLYFLDIFKLLYCVGIKNKFKKIKKYYFNIFLSKKIF